MNSKQRAFYLFAFGWWRWRLLVGEASLQFSYGHSPGKPPFPEVALLVQLFRFNVAPLLLPQLQQLLCLSLCSV